MTSRFAVLAIDALDPDVVAEFWCAFLGWSVLERSDGLELGASRVDVGQPPDVPWIVLADPEGDEFCLLSRSVQEL